LHTRQESEVQPSLPSHPIDLHHLILINHLQVPSLHHLIELGQAGGVEPLRLLRALKTLRGALLSVASVLFSAVSDSNGCVLFPKPSNYAIIFFRR
jgi:hypothetical protein